MDRSFVRPVAALFCCLLVSSALAFRWEPNVVPPGNHSYTLEVTGTSADMANQKVTITIDITEEGDGYTVNTSYQLSQSGIAQDALSDALYGGSMLGMVAFGPLLMYGGGMMFLPMMIGEEDIHVRSEPMVVMGMGSLHMDRTIEAAGHECVLIRFEPNEGMGAPMEFALAENVPFPCYSRYDNGDGTYTEIRLIRAE